jgi:hypothetical protein
MNELMNIEHGRLVLGEARLSIAALGLAIALGLSPELKVTLLQWESPVQP